MQNYPLSARLFNMKCRISRPDPNCLQTLAAAITTMLALQVLMNIGGVTKAIPLTGITLPLISHSGSSLVTSFAMLGLLTALSEPASGRGRK